jgi:hypothetical protein
VRRNETGASRGYRSRRLGLQLCIGGGGGVDHPPRELPTCTSIYCLPIFPQCLFACPMPVPCLSNACPMLVQCLSNACLFVGNVPSKYDLPHNCSLTHKVQLPRYLVLMLKCVLSQLPGYRPPYQTCLFALCTLSLGSPPAIPSISLSQICLPKLKSYSGCDDFVPRSSSGQYPRTADKRQCGDNDDREA